MPTWTRGTSGNPSGRPRGALSKHTKTGREIALGLLRDAEYRRNFTEAWRTRTVHPLIEKHILELAYGRPRQDFQVDVARPAPFLVLDGDGYPLDYILLGEGSFQRVSGEGAEALYKFTPAERPERQIPALRIRIHERPEETAGDG